MLIRRESQMTPARVYRDPWSMLRQMTAELDRLFDDDLVFRRSQRRSDPGESDPEWFPGIDVVEKDNRLVTTIDLPGMKKQDVKVEVVDGQLVISGERKRESEQTKDQFYRSERAYGSFYRTVPLPEGVKVDDIKAIFSDGVLEVSIPIPPKPEAPTRKIEIQDGPKSARR